MLLRRFLLGSFFLFIHRYVCLIMLDYMVYYCGEREVAHILYQTNYQSPKGSFFPFKSFGSGEKVTPSTYRDIQRRKSIALPPNKIYRVQNFHMKTLRISLTRGLHRVLNERRGSNPHGGIIWEKLKISLKEL